MDPDAERQVLDEHLWDLVQLAIAAVKVKIAEHIANGDRVSTVSIPTVSHYDSGWPRIERPLYGTDGAFDYSGLFLPGSRRDGATAYEDVPELMAVIDYLLGDPSRAERLRLGPENADLASERQTIFLQMVAADVVLDVVDRAFALKAPDDPAILRQAFSERERALFSPNLTADIVAPLIMTNLDIDDHLDIGEGVSIERLEDATMCAAARDRHTLEAVTTMVSDAATHAVVVSGAQLKNTSLSARAWTRGSNPMVDLTKVDTAVQALRVVTNIKTGYAQVFLRPHGWADRWLYDLPAVEDVATYRRYPASFDDFGWLVGRPMVSAEALQRLPQVHTAMHQADGATKLAIRRLSMANLRESDDDKLVDACIGIEAMLSTDNAEIAHKIATRGAAALARHHQPPLKPDVTFRLLKTVYKRRSLVVHGDTSARNSTFEFPDNTKMTTVDLAALLLRELLLSKLAGPDRWDVESLDAEMLDSYLRAGEDSDNAAAKDDA